MPQTRGSIRVFTVGCVQQRYQAVQPIMTIPTLTLVCGTIFSNSLIYSHHLRERGMPQPREDLVSPSGTTTLVRIYLIIMRPAWANSY